MSRGRKPIAINKEELTALIAAVESSEQFTSRNALWVAVANTAKAKEIGLSQQVAMLRAKEWGIEPKTPRGMRGRVKGQVVPQTGKRKSKRMSLTIINTLKAAFPEHRHGLVHRAAKGSLTAAVRLKCLDCCNQDVDSIRQCTIVACPLWTFRPYRGNSKVPENQPSVTMVDLGLSKTEGETNANNP